MNSVMSHKDIQCEFEHQTFSDSPILLIFQGRHYVYVVYKCINKTLYSNQSNPVNLLYLSEIIFIM